MFNVIIAICVLTIIGVNIIINTSIATILNLILSFALILVPSLFVLILVRFCPKNGLNGKFLKLAEKNISSMIRLKLENGKTKFLNVVG